MPTYTFLCKECKQQWEEVLKISEIDNPLSEPCPVCDNKAVIRLMSAPAQRSTKRGKNDFNPDLMPPEVKKRLEKIKNTKNINKETSKLDW